MDVLRVHDRDPLRVAAHDVHRVRAARHQVSRVEAQPDAGLVEDPLHLVGVLDHGAPVRVHARRHTGGGTHLGDPVQVAVQRRPALLVEDGAVVVALAARVAGQHQHRPARDAERLQLRLDGGDRVVVGVVHHGQEERAHRGQAVRLHRGRARLRFDGQPALRAELRGRQPQLHHLGEHPVGVHLETPARHLTHAPRDRGSCDFHFVTSTVCPLRAERSAASASTSAATPSSTVGVTGEPLLTASMKAVSSSR